MNIAIDFDGTCVTHEFPNVGKDIGAVSVLKELVEKGHNLILWTMRSNHIGEVGPVGGIRGNGEFLNDAINWFKKNDIPLWGIQTNPEQSFWTASPKAYADLYIDDAALGCPLLFIEEISPKPFVNWVKVRLMLMKMKIL